MKRLKTHKKLHNIFKRELNARFFATVSAVIGDTAGNAMNTLSVRVKNTNNDNGKTAIAGASSKRLVKEHYLAFRFAQ